ncbi:Kelch domain-containing protein 4, partial [Tanacetum coccineum]
FIFETYLPNSLMICNTCDLKIYLYGGYSKEVSSDKNSLEKGIVHHDMWILDHKTWVWNKVFMLLSTLAFTFRLGPRAGFSYAGQIDTTNFRRDGLENGTFTRGESLITSFKNLENDMVLLGKKKNQPQEKYSKMYKNILDDVLADIQDVQGPYIIEKAGQSRMVVL